jgi:uncharacterized protein
MKVDFHTHPVMIKEVFQSDPGLEKGVREVFGMLFPPQPLKVFMLEMDAAQIDKCVLLPIDCSTEHGCKIIPNEIVAELCNQSPRFIGFASVDPRAPGAQADLVHAIKDLGLKGLKLDPALQNFDPAMKKYSELYSICGELKIPILFHCGLTWAPKASISLSNPISIEPVVREFPQTNFVIAHLGWPWFTEACALAMKYPNVYLDTSIHFSGTPATCLSHIVNTNIGKHVFENSLNTKVMFGSNYPRVDIRRTVRGVKEIGFSENLLENIFSGNALKILGA